MFRPRVVLRLFAIQRILLRHGLDEIVRATHLYRPLSWVRRLAPGHGRAYSEDESLGSRLRMALVELGPIFVKFGQSLSTRPDLLPADIATELAKLQDRVPPFSGEQAQQIVETALGRPVSEIFSRFDVEPLAAASIAQVHTAALESGEEVVIKVLRPNVRTNIEADLEVLYAMARLAERFWSESRRLRPVEVVGEYEKTVLDELDLMREAANAAQLGRNFDGSTKLYVPTVHWDYCRPTMLVTERIHGVPVADTTKLAESGTDFKRLAASGVEIFFTQVFQHNFFHADMHPGNIFVDVSNPAYPRYMAVDFGIVGTLSSRDQHYLAENFLAFFNRDYHRVAKLHIDSGWVPPETRLDELESAFRTVCEPIFNKPLSEISFGQFLVRLFRTARRFDMEVQPQLILLQKTLLNIEGLGRQLYPQLDLWETAQPILEKWMTDRLSGRAVLGRLREQLPDLSETIEAMPQLLQQLVQQAADGQLEIRVRDPAMAALERQIAADSKRRYVTASGTAILIAGTLWIGFAANPAWLGWALVASAAVLLWRARPRALTGRRNSRGKY
ncbi:MAG: ubiquinone biosynthesis regulatory protein kinase UbiB [Chromatiales bacterium]|nr:ubiquinone biosynthesis regulatory protein kinase UbiB [Chromatiales bacterium]MDH3945917.1 ubiquinone biosynthesis regulatory protein kinase UbiB [Chromatiales bacterium]MDH4013905.1 ubiquinone biosynthesis regulatory protein kinase UbiB [Chromatiales bacterium]PLX55392.1 MAG: ubiquinone biosynthesis regulatory protein kinase UbiB [Chromatiales bacterium]